MDMNKILQVLLLINILSFPVHAQQRINDLPSRRIEDDSSLRMDLRDSWFNEAPATVLDKRSENHVLRGGSRIQVRTESSGDEFAIVLARELP